MLISHHFHGCKAPLARASHVKWRYTKYLGFLLLLLTSVTCCAGFLGCEIPAANAGTTTAAADADATDAGMLKLTSQSKLVVVNRPDDILLSFHSPATDTQVGTGRQLSLSDCVIVIVGQTTNN